MIAMTLAEIAAVVGGSAHGDAVVTGPASQDSRSVQPGGLYVAISGERVDGHDFAEAAVAAGAVAVLGSRETGVPTVLVDDPVVALGRLARHVRDRLPATVYALTGSQGKTGTKDFLAQILEADGPTVFTEGNQNNELGVPLTVLRATPDTKHLVLEMGARGIGHIAYLCQIAPPDIAAVLNVGTAHVGEFGSQAAIAQAKGEIVEALTDQGAAVLNAGDPLVAAMASRTRAEVITFGWFDPDGPSDSPQLAWHDVRTDEWGRPSAMFQWHDHAAQVTTGARIHLRDLGAHQLANAGAAAAMALAAGVDFATVSSGLLSATSRSRWRMELHERADGALILNDAYNANPASMRAAIDALVAAGAARHRRTVAVLGEMRELGAEADVEHRGVGSYAADAGVDVLVTVGPPGDPIAAGAQGSAVEGAQDHVARPGPIVVRTGSRDDALAWLRENVAADDVVLVKASRGVALEHVADGLLAHDPEDQGDAPV